MRASAAPVLIATDPYRPVEQILVIYDGSDCAMHALHHGAEIGCLRDLYRFSQPGGG